MNFSIDRRDEIISFFKMYEGLDKIQIDESDDSFDGFVNEQQPLDLTSKVKRAFWAGLGTWSSYNLIDSGLARFLALETLTHGAGPLGYMGINLNGADPNYGGGNTGSSVGLGNESHIHNSKNYFHVFKDSEFPGGCISEFGILREVCNQVGNEILPRMHAVLSGMATFGYSIKHRQTNPVKGTVGAVAGFLTPTLKFRFTPEEVINCTNDCRFDNDPDYNHMAYRTTQPISASHLGITGSLTQGVNLGMFSRMANDPGKVMLGVALLGAGAFVAKKTYDYVQSSFSEQQDNQSQISNSSEQSTSYFQNCKKKMRVLAVNSCWVTLAATTIFLNTL